MPHLRSVRPSAAGGGTRSTRPVPVALPALPVLGLVLLVAAAGVQEARALQAPVLSGWVVEQVWSSPVAGAVVVLMDTAFAEVGRTLSDGEGRFRFTTVPGGSYTLQARLDGYAGTLVGPVELGSEAPPDDLVLPLASARTLSVVECVEGGRIGEGGVVLGVAHEVGTDMALPGARILLRWTPDEGGSPEEMEAVADEAGRFHLCGVPAGGRFTIRTEFLGQTGASLEGEVPQPGSVVRSDVALDLGASAREGSVQVVAAAGDAEPGVLAGTVLDVTTARPVQGALVRLPELDREQETDPLGGFRFEGLDEGPHRIELEHLAYGLQRTEVELAEGAGRDVVLSVAPRALALEGFDVTARRRGVGGRDAPRPFPSRALAGERLARMDRQGTSTLAAIRRIGMGLRIRENRPGQACIEAARRATGMNPAQGCQMVVVVLDGVQAMDAAGTLSDLRLSHLESIEYLSPLEAGFRYGMEASARGVLVIWTRGSGPYRSPARDGGG